MTANRKLITVLGKGYANTTFYDFSKLIADAGAIDDTEVAHVTASIKEGEAKIKEGQWAADLDACHTPQ